MSLNMGNAPDVTPEELLSLRGEYCAVEFGSRKLLAHAATWDDVLEQLHAKNIADKRFYCYPVAKNLRLKQHISFPAGTALAE